MPQVGDTDLIDVDVYPFDNTTNATFTVIRPDGTTENLPGTPTEVEAEVVVDGTVQTVTVQRWTSPNVVYTLPKQWVLVAVVTGTGAGVQPKTVWVDPIPTGGGQAWTPNLEVVAAYIPERTVEINRESDGRPVLTFTAATRPTDGQVADLIRGAVGWVLTSCGEVHDSLHDAARDVAAIRAAGMAELAWPVRDGDINAGEALLRQADAGLKSLAARNESLTGVDPDDPDAVFEVAPVWSFPAPSPYGDLLI